MKTVSEIDKKNRLVKFSDGSSINYVQFLIDFRGFLKNRICGETLIANDMERFMRRTSGKNLSGLMKGKKMEGFMEGSMDRMLSAKQKMAIGVILSIVIVVVVVFVILRNQGFF